MESGYGKKFTSEGWLEAEVNVLLGIQAHNEAGHIHHLEDDPNWIKLQPAETQQFTSFERNVWEYQQLVFIQDSGCSSD